ncbi:hypothetical protein [Rhizobium sp. SG2393]|uniref:hypothetical protein n=1 Tax=Rhizobium sp. SG2393 TaxID=3276279 RepID=UPI0036717806
MTTRSAKRNDADGIVAFLFALAEPFFLTDVRKGAKAAIRESMDAVAFFREAGEG